MLKTHGITKDTIKNLIFNAAVIYKNLKFVTEAWEGTVMGATSGGTKFAIEPEYQDAELDGATVALMGAKNKVGEVAYIEGTFTEVTKGLFVDALHLVEAKEQKVTGYTEYISKDNITDTDYFENAAIVGTLNDGKQCIVIMDNAFCTSALELETKNKTQATFALRFDCHATLEQERLNHLPYHVFFPNEEGVLKEVDLQEV